MLAGASERARVAASERHKWRMSELVQRRTPANNLDLMITKCSLIQQKRSQDNNTNLKTKHRLHVNNINQMQQLHSFHDDKIDLMTII